MKLSRLPLLGGNNSGIILIVALWTLVILVILATSLGRNARMEVALTRNSLDKSKADQAAWAGVMMALEQLRIDSQSDDYKDVDNLFYCGFSPEGQSLPVEFFHDFAVGEGTFDVAYYLRDPSFDETIKVYGLQDEERRVNLNAVNITSVRILAELLKEKGVDETTAQTVAHSVIDWIDEDNIVSHQDYGAEEEYYQDLEEPYSVKNYPFESLEELMLVRGMDDEIYQLVKDELTIFPKDGTVSKINFETASPAVLTAVAKSMSGAFTNTDESDAVSLVDKMITYRNGGDGVPLTEDDRQIEMVSMPINSKERTIFLSVNNIRTKVSNYFRIISEGRVRNGEVISRIETIVQREGLKFLDWRRY